MQEHELESFLEQYPDIIEEGLQIVERQKRIGNGTGYIDLLCKDRNGKNVIIELKLEPSAESVAQIAKYVLALQRNGIPREDIRGVLITRFIDEETQQLCDYFNIEAKGLALGKPKKAYFKSIGITTPDRESIDQKKNLGKEIVANPFSQKSNSLKPPYDSLSLAEIVVLKAIISYNHKGQFPSYRDLSKLTNTSMSTIRGHVGTILTKGVPLTKKRDINRTIFLYLKDDNPPNLIVDRF